MRFNLKGLLLTLTVVAVMMAIVAPLVRLLSAEQQLRLLIAVGACLVGVVAYRVGSRWKQARVRSQLGEPFDVELTPKRKPTRYPLLRALTNRVSVWIVLASELAAVAIYAGSERLRGGTTEFVIGCLFLLLIAYMAAMLTAKLRALAEKKPLLYRFGEHGLVVNNTTFTRGDASRGCGIARRPRRSLW